MKSLALLCRSSLTLMVLCLLGSYPAHALLVIHSVVNKDMNDPQTGRIVLRETAPFCGPYDLILTGITTGYQSILSDQNPAPAQLITFDQLSADRYEIKVRDQSGCPYVLTAEIASCNGFAIDLEIPASCKSQPTWVTAVVAPRPYPLTFEWFNSKNQKLCSTTKSYNLDNCRLPPGDHKIKITDAAGCMTMQDFTLSPFDWTVERYRTYACQSQDLVTVLVKNKNKTGFPNRLFEYQWSDGQTYTDKGTIERLIPFGSDYYLTVTDLLTECREEIYLPKSARNENPGYDQHRITYLRHDIDGNNKGAVDIILMKGLKPDLQVRLFRNNQLIQTFTKKDFFMSLKDLSPADYRIDVFDGGIHTCEAGTLSWKILACDGPKNQVSIEVESKKLPMNQDGFKVQFKVLNSGGPCLYKYSMSTGGANAVFINKSVPWIDKQDVNPLLPTSYSNLKAEAFCPCGYASTELNVFPCNNNFKLKTIYPTPIIENPCYGDLFGTYTVLREKGKMEIKFSLPANFASGPDGLPAFGHYLQEIYWGDQSPLLYQIEPGNILSILREVDGPGLFPLYFVDGIGCLYYHLMELKQEFQAKKKGECTYIGYCGQENSSLKKVIQNARLEITDPENCQAVIYCENNGNSRTIQGTRYYGKLNGSASGGRCTYFRYCHFNFEDELSDHGITYPPGVDLINQIYLPGGQSVSGFITRTLVEGDCCQQNYINYQNLLSLVHPWHVPYYSKLFATHDVPDDWPCQALLDCGTGWQLLVGNVSATIHCIENGQCYELKKCDYSNVGKVDGNYVSLNGDSKLQFKKLAVPQSKCDETTQDCSLFAFTNDNPAYALKSNRATQLKVRLYPNPADQTVQVQLDDCKREETIEIALMDLLGRNQIHRTEEVRSGHTHTFELKLADLAEGVYLLRVSQRSEQKILKLVVGHE